MSKKGSITTKQPLDWDYAIEKLERVKDPMHKMYIALGLLTGRRMIDIISLKAEQFKDKLIQFKERKTGKYIEIPISDRLRKCLSLPDSGYLFKSHSNTGHWSKTHAMNIVKFYFGNDAGTHTLRKTLARKIFLKSGVSAAQDFLNHSTRIQTLRYIGEYASEANKVLLEI